MLARGPGLPDYDDDRGNWGETLGVVSLVVEGCLLVLTVTMVTRLAAASRNRSAAAPRG